MLITSAKTLGAREFIMGDWLLSFGRNRAYLCLNVRFNSNDSACIWIRTCHASVSYPFSLWEKVGMRSHKCTMAIIYFQRPPNCHSEAKPKNLRCTRLKNEMLRFARHDN